MRPLLRGRTAAVLRSRRAASLLALGLVLLLTLLPGEEIPDTGIPGIDKLAHLILFGGLAAAFRFDFRRAPAWLLFLIVGAMGLGVELLQTLVPGRSCDMADLAFDLCGAALALLMNRPILRAADALVEGAPERG